MPVIILKWKNQLEKVCRICTEFMKMLQRICKFCTQNFMCFLAQNSDRPSDTVRTTVAVGMIFLELVLANSR